LSAGDKIDRRAGAQATCAPPALVEMVTVERAEWERVNRLLKFCRGDRRRQAQCIADLKGDCDRLYSKLKAAGGEL